MLFEFPVRARPAISTDQNPKAISTERKQEPSGLGRSLAAKEVLFRAGDARTSFYRVETGAICLYEPRWHDERSIIDFAFPGDYVGLGFLETQSCSASAVCECQVRCIPWDQLNSAVAGNPNAQQKLHEATEREFELRRTSIVQRGLEYAIERVAAFLVVLSHNNSLEGRDPHLIGDSMECGIAADYLGLSVEKLGALLVELKKRGLIDLCPDKSLRILDINALQELAEQRDDPLSVSRATRGCCRSHPMVSTAPGIERSFARGMTRLRKTLSKFPGWRESSLTFASVVQVARAEFLASISPCLAHPLVATCYLFERYARRQSGNSNEGQLIALWA